MDISYLRHNQYNQQQLLRMNGKQQQWILDRLAEGRTPGEIANLALSVHGRLALAYQVLCAASALQKGDDLVRL